MGDQGPTTEKAPDLHGGGARKWEMKEALVLYSSLLNFRRFMIWHCPWNGRFCCLCVRNRYYGRPLPPAVEAIKKRANEVFEMQKYGEAICLYNQAISMAPNLPILYGNRAAAYLKRSWYKGLSSYLIHLFITEIYIAPLQGYYSEALLIPAPLK